MQHRQMALNGIKGIKGWNLVLQVKIFCWVEAMLQCNSVIVVLLMNKMYNKLSDL